MTRRTVQQLCYVAKNIKLPCFAGFYEALLCVRRTHLALSDGADLLIAAGCLCGVNRIYLNCCNDHVYVPS